MRTRHPAMQWTAAAGLVLAVILIPFIVLEQPVSTFALTSQQRGGGGRWTVGLATVALLTADVVLPIPSSVVSTAAGYLLGAAGGILSSFTGLMLGSVFGYWLGARAGIVALERLVSAEQRTRFAALTHRFGALALIIARPIPVLAEASVILAGAARMPLRVFLAANAVANLAVATTYAVAGSVSGSRGSVLIALAVLLGVPVAALMLRRKAFR